MLSFIRKSNINSSITRSIRYISHNKSYNNNNNISHNNNNLLNNNNVNDNNNENDIHISHNNNNLLNKTKTILAKTAITFIAIPPFAASVCLGYECVASIINGYHQGILSYPIGAYGFNFAGLTLSTIGICAVSGNYLFFYNCISKYMEK